jgi:asparagine synthase (glutamine-hydrolysing)
MCGITCVFAYHVDAPSVERREVEAVTARMFARGPDAGGTWYSEDGRVGLGSRRLAIIDLSAEGTQPMFDVERELVIVFNGEIYNHRELRARLETGGARFHSTSDTEVLLQLYRRDGEAMVELLRGMFAFTIWDTRTRRMFVARDPYGIKPLYFVDDGRTFRAASQVKALLAGGGVSRTRDNAGLAGFFVMGSVPEPFTTYESIRAVEAGSSFCVGERGREQRRRYYSISAVFRDATAHRSIASLVQPSTLLREFVDESARAHLVSDVPVGAFLSAGIDSTALSALAMSATNHSIRTVTLQFDVHRETELDEAPMAERFASERGFDHKTRFVSRDEVVADLPKYFEAMDQPTIDGMNTWFVSKAAAERGLKVAISGLGGDELFGSYPSFTALPQLVRMSRILRRIPLGGRIGSRAALIVTRNPKARAVGLYGHTWPGAYLVQRGLYMPWELPLVMEEEAARDGLETLQIIDAIAAVLEPDPGTNFGRVGTLEAALYMRNQLLRDTDWASMAHSLEVRTPLVDAWFLRQIAPLLVVEGKKCKQYFAGAPDPPLPGWLRARPKSGFSVPLREWLDLPADGTTTRMRSWAEIVYERCVGA